MMLAFSSGICGNMVSPLHLCLVLTRNYFQADWRGIYRLLCLPVASVLILGLLIALFWPV